VHPVFFNQNSFIINGSPGGIIYMAWNTCRR